MAMKALSFLRCGVVIVLSLFAGRAGAQSDSVNLRLYLQGDGVGYSFDNSSSSTSNNTSLYRHIPDSINIASIDNATCNLWFTIDTISSMIRHLRIDRPMFAENKTLGGDEEFIFDSLPFIGSWKDGLKIPGKVYNVQASWSVYDAQGKSISGTTFQEDSLYFEIGPLYSMVSNSQTGIFPILQVAWNWGTNTISTSFPPSDSPRIIELVDLLGRTAESAPVPSGTEYAQLLNNLPPGCYFARLGYQVAKFVVPPR